MTTDYTKRYELALESALEFLEATSMSRIAPIDEGRGHGASIGISKDREMIDIAMRAALKCGPTRWDTVKTLVEQSKPLVSPSTISVTVQIRSTC